MTLPQRLALTLALTCTVAPLVAQNPGASSRRATQGENAPDKEKDESSVPIPPETTSVTRHDWSGGGSTIHYTATAGNLNIKDEKNATNGSIFYVAYTQDGAEAKARPVTFFYNGGPGSASIWLHMGSFGPVRVITQSPDATAPPPFEYVSNQYSLLDKSDLIFIDAPLTGFSRAVGKGTAKDFAGTDEDIRAFKKFIVRYITLNQRWNSPKFLFGESYGTTRSAGLVAALQNDGIEFNGVTLLSTILNYGVRNPGYDAEAIGYLPSFAAIAWHFDKVKHTGTMAEYVQKAREFARGPYAEALMKGDTLAPAEFNAVAQKLAEITGLSVTYVTEARLRISATRFRKELLRDQDSVLGRYDARFTGPDVDDAGEAPGYDPSDTGISGAYVGAFHQYIEQDLKYTSSEPYYLSGPGLNQDWNFKHSASGSRGQQMAPDVAVDLADAMRKNPKLKIFSANGYFDLATPFAITEYDLHHMLLPPAIAANIQFGYYPAGHMVYLNVEALKEMKADMNRFYTEATRR